VGEDRKGGTPVPDAGLEAAPLEAGGRDPLAQRLWHGTYRNEVVALLLLLVLIPFFPLFSSGGPSSVPLEVWLLGLVPGATLAMQSLAAVLVYRSNRFLNFGQIYLGVLGASVFVYGSQYLPFYRWIRTACPPCLGEQASHRQWLVNYWLSVVLGLLVAVAAAWFTYVVVVKRFENRPRLTVTVASIFLAPAAIAVIGFLTNVLTTTQQREKGPLVVVSPLPFKWDWQVGSAHFSEVDILTVVIGLLAVLALGAYLRFGRTGLAIRAAADSGDRAELLGINVHKTHARVWVVVGLLSGVSALLGTMGTTPPSFTSVSVDGIVRVLLVMVVARFVSLTMAGVAALVVGIVETSTLWSFNGSPAPFNGALVVFVGVLLLLRTRERSTRAETLQGATLSGAREIRPIPPELRELPTVRRVVRGLGVLLAVLLLGLPWVLSPGQTNLAAIAPIYAIIGLSLLVLTGWGGQISLGQFAFAAVGGFVIATWHVPTMIGLLGASLAGAALAVAVGVPALRLQGNYLMISTLALSVSVSTIVVSPRYLGKHLPSTLARPSVFGISLENQRIFYYTCLFFVVLAVLVVMGLRRSRLGRVLIAARENEQSAMSFGVPVVRARLTGFAVSGFLAALAGALFAYHQHGVPLAAFNETQSLDMFTMSVLGGLGSIAGPLLGATYKGVLLVFGSSPTLQAFFVGFGGLGLLLLAPGGLSQVGFGLRDSFLRRVAKRHRLVVPSLVADVKAEREDRRVPLAARQSGPRGSYVPRRYYLDGQWGLPREPASSATAGDAGFQGLAEQLEPAESGVRS
jgi:branched-chain amino acid transport system permease protein